MTAVASAGAGAAVLVLLLRLLLLRLVQLRLMGLVLVLVLLLALMPARLLARGLVLLQLLQEALLVSPRLRYSTADELQPGVRSVPMICKDHSIHSHRHTNQIRFPSVPSLSPSAVLCCLSLRSLPVMPSLLPLPLPLTAFSLLKPRVCCAYLTLAALVLVCWVSLERQSVRDCGEKLPPGVAPAATAEPYLAAIAPAATANSLDSSPLGPSSRAA